MGPSFCNFIPQLTKEAALPTMQEDNCIISSPFLSHFEQFSPAAVEQLPSCRLAAASGRQAALISYQGSQSMAPAKLLLLASIQKTFFFFEKLFYYVVSFIRRFLKLEQREPLL